MARTGKKVAIVHDWLVGGGAELVVEQLHQLFPDAPIYTSYCTPEWRTRLNNKVVTGYLQHWPFSALRKFLPVLRIWWFTRLKFEDYDLVISSSGNGEAKGIKVPERTLHVSYIHAPTHFYWRHYQQYVKQPGFGVFNPLARFGLKLLVKPLRKWDHKAAQRPHHLIANSTHIQKEIKKFYNRDSTVIHPPVYIERFSAVKGRQPRKGFVIAGRQVPFKQFALAIKACNQLGAPLTVIGDGPEHSRLRKLGRRTIIFLGRVSDEVMEEELASAEAFLFPSYEDFGITPVEALASGTPVIAYKAGGALDFVEEGKTGLFFKEQTVDSLLSALERFPQHEFRPEMIRKEAENFSRKSFQRKFIAFLKSALKN